MTDETEFKELSKNRAYLLRIGGIEVAAMKLEGYKAIQLGGTLSPYGVGGGGGKAEGDDWLLVVKDENKITMPYEAWVKQAVQEIGKATGSNIGTVSLASNATVASNAVAEQKKKKS